MERGSTDTGSDEIKGLSAWLLTLMVVIAPLSGWRKLRSSAVTGQEYAASVFYPILAMMAISVFADALYSNVTLKILLVRAIICFASGFFSYFFIQMLFRALCSGDILKVLTGNFGQKFSMLIISTLCIYVLVYNLVPILDVILVYFPIYTLYLIFKGLPILLLPRLRTRKNIVIVICLNLLVPVAMYVGLDWILMQPIG